jgi:hypothetical protein
VLKTSARFHTSLFRSLLGGLRAFRVEKIAKNLALLDRLQNVVEFLHGLAPLLALRGRPDERAESARKRTEPEPDGCAQSTVRLAIFGDTEFAGGRQKLVPT